MRIFAYKHTDNQDTDNQDTDNQVINSKTEATLILCG